MSRDQQPKNCPFCGFGLEVVRAVFGGIYEVACNQCERTAVIHVDDYVSLPSPKPAQQKGQTG